MASSAATVAERRNQASTLVRTRTRSRTRVARDAGLGAERRATGRSPRPPGAHAFGHRTDVLTGCYPHACWPQSWARRRTDSSARGARPVGQAMLVEQAARVRPPCGEKQGKKRCSRPLADEASGPLPCPPTSSVVLDVLKGTSRFPGQAGLMKTRILSAFTACAGLGLAPLISTSSMAAEITSGDGVLIDGTVEQAGRVIASEHVRLILLDDRVGGSMSAGAGVDSMPGIELVRTMTDAEGHFTIDAKTAAARFDHRSGIYDAVLVAGTPGQDLAVVNTSLAYDATARTFEIAPSLLETTSDVDGSTNTTEVVAEPGSTVRRGSIVSSPGQVGHVASDIQPAAFGGQHAVLRLVNQSAVDVQALDETEGGDGDVLESSTGGVDTTSSSTKVIATYYGILTYVGSIHAETSGYSGSSSTSTVLMVVTAPR